MAASSNVVGRSELEDGAGASRLCEAGPSSGEGGGLVAPVVVVAVVAVARGRRRAASAARSWCAAMAPPDWSIG